MFSSNDNFKKGTTNNDKGCGNDSTFSQKPWNDHEIVLHVIEENSSKTVNLFIQKNFDPAKRFGDGRGKQKIITHLLQEKKGYSSNVGEHFSFYLQPTIEWLSFSKQYKQMRNKGFKC